MPKEEKLFFHDLIQQLTLESKLAQTFEFDKIFHLFPKELWPDFSQGLPRHLDPDSPCYLEVKKDFDNFSVLKQKVALKYLSFLYHCCSLTHLHTIILITYVVPGGLGDFYFQKFIAELIEQMLPNQTLLCFSFIHITAPSSLEARNNQFIYRFENKEDLHPSKFPAYLLEKLSCASCVIQIPTPHPYWKEILTYLPPSAKTLSFGEYGFIQHESYSPKTDHLSLGLHFLEYGLLLKNIKPGPLETLSLEFVKNIIHTDPYYFCYFFTKEAAQLYLAGIALSAKNQLSPLLFITQDVGLFLHDTQKLYTLLQGACVKTLTIYYKNYQTTLNLNHDGKNITLIHTGTLSHEDFLILLKHSQEPVGIRGNLSISEAISLGKKFFYDPLVHNLPFFYELLALAKDYSPLLPTYIKLFKNTHNLENAHILAFCISSESFREDFENYLIKLKVHYQAAPFFKGSLIRQLFHRENVDVEKKEQELLALFHNGSVDFATLSKSINDLVCNNFQQNPN